MVKLLARDTVSHLKAQLGLPSKDLLLSPFMWFLVDFISLLGNGRRPPFLTCGPLHRAAHSTGFAPCIVRYGGGVGVDEQRKREGGEKRERTECTRDRSLILF